MDCLILRFDAPLMSFGAVVVDQINPIWRFPGASMLAGLVGNALGWCHADTERLQALQDRLYFAARWDAEPDILREYQTVDLGQSHLVGTGWTTRGQREDRGGGTAAMATHQRWRSYWANGIATLAVALKAQDKPQLDAIERALRTPSRPLFLGRKPCLPASPILIGRRQGSSVKAILQAEPLADVGCRCRPDRVKALWPLAEGSGHQDEERFDLRDWTGNIHRASQRYAVGFLEVVS